MSEFRVNSITNQDGSAGPQVCGVSTFSGKSGFQIPSGPTEFRRQDGGGRGRGVFSGGRNNPVYHDTMNSVEIATTANATDFGFYGKYVESSTTKYAGIFYDASTDNTFRLFADTQTVPGTTVNTGATGYAAANLVAGSTIAHAP